MTDPAGQKCIDANGDIDGDGIPNSLDKCQHMAGGMYDEDGDGIGDECDKCPIAKPPATPDTDHDDVDSPCDPNPTTDGEKIVLFNGFNGGAIPDGWLPSAAGVWTVSGGEAIVTSASDTASYTLLAPLPSSSAHTVVMSAYRVDTVSATATEADAAVVAQAHLPLGDTDAQCGGLRMGPVDFLQVKTNNGSVTKDQANLFDSAGLYKVAMQLEGAAANCAMIANSESGAVSGQINGFQPNQAGFVAQGGKMRFEYLMVVQRTN